MSEKRISSEEKKLDREEGVPALSDQDPITESTDIQEQVIKRRMAQGRGATVVKKLMSITPVSPNYRQGRRRQDQVEEVLLAHIISGYPANRF